MDRAWESVSMTCKAHGDCLLCRLDSIEDRCLKLEAMYGPGWEVLQNIEDTSRVRLAQHREYVDAQVRRLEDGLAKLTTVVDILTTKVKK
jgi:hypothetical protein